MTAIGISFRQKVVSACTSFLDGRIKELESQLKDLTAGAENDSKSSAGDKHETSRAMMQREHENISRQLEGFLKEKNELSQLTPGNGTTISNGSLVRTNRGIIFIGVALGKIIVDTTEVIALSHRSPLGNKLLGLAKGESLSMNGIQYVIEEVF